VCYCLVFLYMWQGYKVRHIVGSMNDENFEVVFHHGGRFVNEGSLKYVGDSSTLLCDPDRWSFFEIMSILREMGYVNVKELWFSVGGGSVLEGRLELLNDDRGVCHMVNIATLNGQVHLYVVHFVCEPQVVHMIEDQPAVEGDGGVAGEEVAVQTENESRDGDIGVANEDVCVGDGEEELPDKENGVGNEEVCVGDGEEELPDKENGVGNEEVCVRDGEEALADKVNTEVGEEDGEHEVGGETGNEEDDEYEVSSWTESEGDVMNEDELYDVRIDRDDMDDELHEVSVGCHEMPGASASTGTMSQDKNVYARGISDNEWESETLDSGDHSDSTDQDRDNYGHFGTFSMPKSMEDYNWEVGTYFAEKEEFTDAIRTYGLHSGRKLKIFRNDKRRICVKCLGAKGKCKWYAYCAYKAAQNTWQLRKIINTHTCSREFNVCLMTSKWLSGRLEKTLKENPNIKLTDLKNKIGRKWNIGVSRSTTFRAKSMAYANIDGSFREQYKRVYDYAHELLKSNPGSTVKVHVDENEGNPIFKRLYVCLKASKDSFISCRPIIGVDGCFLKGKYGGELLTAVGRDGNDQMLPLAYAVVEVENKETWTWFLELLIEDLNGAQFCQTFTFMSDQQKVSNIF